MTVQDLIQKLQKYQPDMEVLFQTEDGWCYNIDCSKMEYVDSGRVFDRSKKNCVVLF